MSIWYYVINYEQQGPVGEAELRELALRGRIGRETLIWREGMEEWVPLGAVPEFQNVSVTAPAAAVSLEKGGERLAADYGGAAGPITGSASAGEAGEPMVWCAECGRPVAENEAFRVGGQSVCADCKPLFLQRVKESGRLEEQVEFAGFWIRGAALVLDGFIFAVPLYLMIYLVTAAMNVPFQATVESVWLGYALAVPLTALETWFVYHFGGTPGKLLLKLRIVNEDGGRVTLRQAVGRCVWSTVLTHIPTIGIALYLLNCLQAVPDPEKRAFHDTVFKTRVIRQEG